MLWFLLVESDRSHFKLAWSEKDLSWLLKPWCMAFHFAIWLSCFSLPSLGFHSLCTLARQLPRRDGSEDCKLTAHIPAALCLHLSFVLEPRGQQTPRQLAWSGSLWENRKALSRELVDKSQHGSQGLPCLPSSATQESRKVNFFVLNQAPF